MKIIQQEVTNTQTGVEPAELAGGIDVARPGVCLEQLAELSLGRMDAARVGALEDSRQQLNAVSETCKTGTSASAEPTSSVPSCIYKLLGIDNPPPSPVCG